MHMNKVILITGGTSGIGKATAKELAKLGYNLILTARDEIRGQTLSESLSTKYHIKSEFIKCDISSLMEVKSFADKVISRYTRLDVLINNAGSRFDNQLKSADGIELTFATNYLGHFLLSYYLMNLLRESNSARIINVSSSAHGGNKLDIDDLVNPKIYNRSKAYGISKLANIFLTYELSRKLNHSNVTVNTLHPGGVLSGFAKNNGIIPWLKHNFYYLIHGNLRTPRQGSETIVYLALSPEVEGISGKYYYEKKEIKSSEESYNTEKAKKLWDLSTKLCGIKWQ